MGSEYIGNGYGQSKAGGCVGGVGCLADVGCGGNACGAAACGANVCGVDGCGVAACGINACPLIIPGLFEPPVRTLRFFRNYPFWLF